MTKAINLLFEKHRLNRMLTRTCLREGRSRAVMRLRQRAKALHWSKWVRAASRRVVQFAAIFN